MCARVRAPSCVPCVCPQLSRLWPGSPRCHSTPTRSNAFLSLVWYPRHRSNAQRTHSARPRPPLPPSLMSIFFTGLRPCVPCVSRPPDVFLPVLTVPGTGPVCVPAPTGVFLPVRVPAPPESFYRYRTVLYSTCCAIGFRQTARAHSARIRRARRSACASLLVPQQGPTAVGLHSRGWATWRPSLPRPRQL